jgi:hypothetical protein
VIVVTQGFVSILYGKTDQIEKSNATELLRFGTGFYGRRIDNAFVVVKDFFVLLVRHIALPIETSLIILLNSVSIFDSKSVSIW